MRSPAVLAVAVACSGPAPVPAPMVASAHPTPAPVTCRDVAAILRGAVTGNEEAGRARESAIAGSCATDRWSPEVVDCVARERHPQVCLKRLDAAQAAAYDGRIAAWHRAYGDEVDGHDSPDQAEPPDDGDR